jgi:hypothetical protein
MFAEIVSMRKRSAVRPLEEILKAFERVFN